MGCGGLGAPEDVECVLEPECVGMRSNHTGTTTGSLSWGARAGGGQKTAAEIAEEAAEAAKAQV